jgi:hypothetical protein
MYHVVDTNVLVVANGKNKAPQASLECINSCVKYLSSLQKSGVLVIDKNWLILKEYKNNVSEKGQPEIGDRFLYWLLKNQTNRKHCEQVTIKQISEYEFEEFPQSESLKNFDKSDRKFVAVALTHPAKPAIANAVDSDWRNYEEALADHGVSLNFLCPELAAKN